MKMENNFLEKALESKAANGIMIGGAILSGLVLLGKLLCGPSDDELLEEDCVGDLPEDSVEVLEPADVVDDQKEE